MGITFPSGSRLSFSTALSAPIKITDTSNEAPPFATLSGDITVKTGDVVVVDTNWSRLAETVAVAGQLTEDHKLRLLGHDTSDTFFCPPGEGSGSLRVVTSWETFHQIPEVNVSGGEQNFYETGYLDDPSNIDRKYPTSKSAVVIALKLEYDPDLSWFEAAKRIDALGKPVALRIKLAGRDTLYRYGYLSINPNPTLVRNQSMQVSVNFACIGNHVLMRAS